MECFKTSYHIRCSSEPELFDTLRQILRGAARLLPERGGWFSLYDASTDQFGPSEMNRLSGELSQELGAPVLALALGNQGTLAYSLHDRGALREKNPEVLREYCPQLSLDEARELQLAIQGATDESLESRMDSVVRKNAGAVRPDSMQAVLKSAAEQVRDTPPGMLKMMFASMGIPADDPTLAPLLQDPAGFLERLSADTDGLRAFADERGSEWPASVLAARPLLARLAEAFGIEPARATLSFGEIHEPFKLILPDQR